MDGHLHPTAVHRKTPSSPVKTITAQNSLKTPVAKECRQCSCIAKDGCSEHFMITHEEIITTPGKNAQVLKVLWAER